MYTPLSTGTFRVVLAEPGGRGDLLGLALTQVVVQNKLRKGVVRLDKLIIKGVFKSDVESTVVELQDKVTKLQDVLDAVNSGKELDEVQVAFLNDTFHS